MAEHIVYDSTANNIVIGVYKTNSEAVTEAAKSPAWGSTQIVNTPAVDIGWYADLTKNPVTVSAALPTAAMEAVTEEQQYRRISAAFLRGIDSLPTWRAAISTTANNSLNATRRWLFHQAALATAVSDATAFASLTEADRATLFDHILNIMITQSEAQFSEFQNNSTRRNDWAGKASSAGSTVNTDLATTSGAVRVRDGTSTAITGVTIPTKFTPEHADLT